MAGSGKAKYLAGLQSLVQGFTAMDERRRQRLLDNLEREKFEYEKSLDVGAAQERRENRILGIREKQFDRMIDMDRIRQEQEENRRKHILGSRDKAFSRMLGLGRLKATEGNLAAREASLGLSRDREARIAAGGDGGGGAGEYEGPTDEGTQAYLGKILGLGAIGTPKRDEYEGMRLKGVPVISALGAAEKFKVPTAANERADAAAGIRWIDHAGRAIDEVIDGVVKGDLEKGKVVGRAIKQTRQYEELLSLDPEERADALAALKTTGLSYFGLGE